MSASDVAAQDALRSRLMELEREAILTGRTRFDSGRISTDEEFEAMAARLRGRREAFRDEIASGLAELIEVLEPEEWTKTINLMLDEEDRWRELGR